MNTNETNRGVFTCIRVVGKGIRGTVINSADRQEVDCCTHNHRTTEAAYKCAEKLARQWNKPTSETV